MSCVVQRTRLFRRRSNCDGTQLERLVSCAYLKLAYKIDSLTGVIFDEVMTTDTPSTSKKASKPAVAGDERTPVFSFDNERISGARTTLELVDEVWREPDKFSLPLLPREPVARAHVRRACDVIEQSVVTNFQAWRAAEEEHDRKSHFVKLLQGLLAVFADVTQQRFICGDAPSLPDVLLAPVAHRVTTLAPAVSRGRLFVPECRKFDSFWRWWRVVKEEEFFLKSRLTDEFV